MSGVGFLCITRIKEMVQKWEISLSKCNFLFLFCGFQLKYNPDIFLKDILRIAQKLDHMLSHSQQGHIYLMAYYFYKNEKSVFAYFEHSEFLRIIVLVCTYI